MLESNQNLLNSILVLPLSQIATICDATDDEGAYDFLGWLHDSLATSEEDHADGIETQDDITEFLLAMATSYEPSDATNAYQERLERKRNHYESMAAKRQAESDGEWSQSRRMGDAIPFGQPILVGHHSEGRDRRYRDRIWNKMGKAVKLADTAKYHAARAERVGSGGISGDDPNKIIKLRRKLAGAQHLQERMKAANKVVKAKRKSYTEEAKIADLQAQGFSHTDAIKLMTPGFGGVGFASFQLTNNNANIRNIAERIAEEEANAAMSNIPDQVYTLPNGDEVTVEYNSDDNRIRLHFPGKPDESTLSTVKRAGFKWSPYNKAWQRQMTANARASVRYLFESLKAVQA